MQPSAVSFEGDRVRVPASALDHAGFREWVKSAEFPDGARASFVAGELFIEMSPDSIDSHNKVKLEVSSVVHQLVRTLDLGEAYADRALLTHEGAGISTEPDAMVATWATLTSGRVRRVLKKHRSEDAIELVGTPDLVVEVVSDSSVRKDLVLLRAGYARAGIPEYWVIDARGESIRFEILALGEDGYAPSASPGAPQPSPLLGRAFDLTRAKNPIGTWTYTLTPTP